MNPTWNLVLLAGFYPLLVAWRSSAGSTIRHALGWAVAAWAAWCVGVSPEWRYVALCLTACAGVAVLGRARPGAGAWHFVVVGLLVTLLLPLLMGLGELRLQREQVWFLGAVLLVGVANYLPTRLFVPAALLLACCGLELAAVAGLARAVARRCARCPSPCRGRRGSSGRRPGSRGVDRAWWLFRHRFGFLWAERMRDQFNRAADNANLGATLGRGGFVGPMTDEARERAETLLAALLGRFDTADPVGRSRELGRLRADRHSSPSRYNMRRETPARREATPCPLPTRSR